MRAMDGLLIKKRTGDNNSKALFLPLCSFVITVEFLLMAKTFGLHLIGVESLANHDI